MGKKHNNKRQIIWTRNPPQDTTLYNDKTNEHKCHKHQIAKIAQQKHISTSPQMHCSAFFLCDFTPVAQWSKAVD